MSRNLLHKSKLENFKTWLMKEGIQFRPGRGDFEVIQIFTKNRHNPWQCIFDRLDTKEHYTVAAPLEGLVYEFIKATRVQKDVINDRQR